MAVAMPSSNTMYTLPLRGRRTSLIAYKGKGEEAGPQFLLQTDEVNQEQYSQEPTQVVVWVNSLDSESVRLVRPIPLSVVRLDNGFVASFWDANIHAPGETISDALDGLKSLLIDAYEMLSEHKDALGPEPMKEFAVLSDIMQPSK